MTRRSVAKDFYRLQKNIASFSNGEARVVSFDDDFTFFDVELNIKDGLYKNGIFVFGVHVDEGYPEQVPTVTFKSPIFHPNIGDGYDEGNVCLNLLSEEWQGNDLEDVVQGMLFLIKNPALDDTLNPLLCGFLQDFDEDTSAMTRFAALVRQSLEGGNVEGVEFETRFERNPGLVVKDKIAEEISKMSRETENPGGEIASEKTNSTIDNTNLALVMSFPIPGTAMNICSKDELYRCALYWVYKNFSPPSGKTAGCPKWLAKLAAFMFGDKTERRKNSNLFLRNLRTFQTFPFFNRTLTWNTK